jgi:prepilin-type processing-associated H-X9-DG protein
MPISFTCPHCGLQTNVADEYAGQTGPCAGCGKTITVPSAGPRAPYGPPTYPPKRSTPVVLIVVLVAALVFLCSGVPIALLLPAVQAAREAARRSQCTNNLKQLALAMHNYHDAYQTFPPAYIADEDGKPMHSWRVLLLPYLEQQGLYERYEFDEPWDSPANLALAQTVLDVYRCPSDPESMVPETNYVMIVGPGTLYEGEEPTSIADVTDGTSNTIMLVEVAGSGINWLEPRDLDIEQLSFQVNPPSGKGIHSHHPGGANVAFCDGSVRFLSDGIDPRTLEYLITIADGNPVTAY